MQEKEILHQIIDNCDDALRDAFLRRMEIATRLMEPENGGGDVYDPQWEQAVLTHVTTGLSPELTIKATSLWRSLMRMSRGKQYRYTIQHNPSLHLPHEADLVDELRRDGLVLCPADMARTVSAALGMEVVPCHAISAAIDALLADQGDFAALVVNSFYDTEWLYSMIYDQPLYINSFIPLPDERMLALFSKKLFNDDSNRIVSVAFAIRTAQYGDLSQTLATLAEAKFNVEFLRVKTMGAKYDDQMLINIVFAELSGSLTALDSRAAFLQLQKELPFFRVIGYRVSY
ncbi:MAG: chorismate mutase [Clostridia bacterium]|nr:chorismate mutase [Clostridia bacterium]